MIKVVHLSLNLSSLVVCELSSSDRIEHMSKLNSFWYQAKIKKFRSILLQTQWTTNQTYKQASILSC